LKLLHKNGNTIWVEIVSFYQKNPKTGRIESIGTNRDITKRKITQIALLKSEQQYRLLFENMNEAFALHKILTNEKGVPVDYEFIDINSKFEQFTGLKKENIIGKTVLEIMPNTEKYWIERYGKVALDNEPQEFSDYSGELDKYYQVKVYSPQYQYFAVTFSDITFQHKAEKILQQSEEKFKNRFAYFPFPTFIWQRKDDDFVMISANKAAYDQSNGEIENIFGIKSRILWKNEPELSDYLDNCFNSKSNFTIERYYYFRGSKKNQYVSTTYSFLPPDNVQIITMDITDRKLAEEEIRSQKKLFETMFNAIYDGVVITDINRKILMANNGMKSTFGYQPENLIGKTTEMLYVDSTKFNNSGEEVFDETAQGSENLYITYYKDAEGNTFPGETFGTKLFDNSGVWIGNLGIIRNISERQKMISDLLKAKEKAEESENKYRNLVETAQELIWKCDNKGKFTYLNQAWEQTHGYKIEEMLGKGFDEFQLEEVFQRDSTEFSKTLIKGAIKNYETTHISKEGRELTLLFNAIPVFDIEGNIIGSQGTATDISDRKNYEKELEDHRNNLEKLVQERTDELKAASEELRSNLIELIEIRESLLKSEDVLNEVQSLGAIGGWSYDVSGNEAWWTKGLFELHDLPFDRHSSEIQKKIEQSIICYPEQDRELVNDSFNKAVIEGIPYALEHIFTTYKGRRIWVKNVGKPVSENGKIVRVIGALIDITEQKNSEMLLQSAKAMIESSNEELKASNVELYQQKEALEETLKKLHEAQAQLIQSEKMASLGILVAGVAHEINNPVNFISASLSGLKNNLDYLSGYTSLYNQIDKNTREVIKKIKEKEKEASFEEVLEMFRRSIDIIEVGIERTTKIVKGLRSFARSDETKLDKYNVHENIENT
ncbi:MAG: PAS domain S-box protein, partial [Bacteroidales bacterium]|nr:PAS domain S-box protein [Bacteroidales bacterium]